LKLSRPKVLLAVPNGSGWLHKHVHFATIRLLQDKRVEIEHIAPTHSPYVNNLHLIQQDFLARDFDFLISIDDDNPPFNNICDLVLLDKDVIGCPTPVWHCSADQHETGERPYYYNALIEVENGYRPVDSFPGFKPEGLQQVHAIGSGCMVIARRVLEAIDAPFMRVWNQKGIVDTGGDYAFCKRAREKGFKIFAHFDYPCRHFNELELNEVIKAFMSMKHG
jgi:hypothetical protein